MTDFGPGSPYVGQMKLVLEALAPGAPVLDLAHDLPPQNLAAAALVLLSAREFLPLPCVLCAVVDPGVGSARKILLAEFTRGVLALAPDNGLLAPWFRLQPPLRVRAVTNRALFNRRVSSVFHGRDIFAPVAARLAAGLRPERVGPAVPLRGLCASPWPEVSAAQGGLKACVVYEDRFGNLVTNLYASRLRRASAATVRLGRRKIPLVDHYAQAKSSQPLALIGSFGFLEIAVRDGSAARVLEVGIGADVLVETKRS
ncbi:MAG: SAM-dependent chlorinase/fluorinase [Planctomycetes bacterium]|nr:SAM-dependent chlorinase/fluorinase [Planctomycetota bacterium]